MWYDTSVIDSLVEPFADLPPLRRIIRKPHQSALPDIQTELTRQLENCPAIRQDLSGRRIAIAVGSRGIANLALLARTVVRALQAKGAKPFLIPAMGSHGGGTPEGQRAVLAEYGISEASMGVPIDDSMAVEQVGEIAPGVPHYLAQAAAQADAIVVIARIKPHTDFRGKHESGLIKMIGIGLGKHQGALALHSRGFAQMEDGICAAARTVLGQNRILMGVAVVENECHQTCWLRCVEPADFFAVDEKAQIMAKTLLGSIPYRDLDILLLGEIGKDISGAGLDPNVADRFQFAGKRFLTGPNPKLLIVSDLSEGTHGNATGLGLADLATARVWQKIDYTSTYINCITSRELSGGRVPIIAEHDAKAVQIALLVSGCQAGTVRMVAMRNTLDATNLYISPALVAETTPDRLRDDYLILRDGTYQWPQTLE
jgi:hypothetical protein